MEREQAEKLVNEFIESFNGNMYPDSAALGACMAMLKETLVYGTDHAIKVMKDTINEPGIELSDVEEY